MSEYFVDLKDLAARIAGDEPLVFVIDEQIEGFQDQGADQRGIAFRFDDRRRL